MYADVHFLGGKLRHCYRAGCYHEGTPTPQRRFSTTSGRPWGGLQTLTNFFGGNHNGRFLAGALLPPRSLQPPRVTRCTTKTRGESTFALVNVQIEHFSFASQKIKIFGCLRREISKKSRSENGGERNGAVKCFVRRKKTIYRWGWNLAVGGRFLRSPKVLVMDGSSGPQKFRPSS